MKTGVLVGACLLMAIIHGGCFSSPKTANDKQIVMNTQSVTEKNRGDEKMREQEAKEELEKLYHVMWQAMLQKDIPALDKMHDEGFVLVHMTGMRQPKDEFLRAIRDGDLNYFTEQTEHVLIDVNEDKAILTGQSKVEAAVFGGSRNTWPLQLVFEVEKRNGQWVLINAKASTY